MRAVGSPECKLPSLDCGFWDTDSPFIMKATAVHEATAISHTLTRRQLWGRGKAEQRALLYFLLEYRTVTLEQPFRVRYNNSTGTPDVITGPDEWYERGEPTPWEETTVWEIKDTSLFYSTLAAAKERDRLQRQIERCQALCEVAGCRFSVLFVEVPHRPEAPDLRILSEQYNCPVQVLSTTVVRNLILLRRHAVLLAGRDESLFDSVLAVASGLCATFSVPEVAGSLGQPLGKICYHLLHAVQNGVCAFKLEQQFSLYTTQFSLHPDWLERTESLRERNSMPANHFLAPVESDIELS